MLAEISLAEHAKNLAPTKVYFLTEEACSTCIRALQVKDVPVPIQVLIAHFKIALNEGIQGKVFDRVCKVVRVWRTLGETGYNIERPSVAALMRNINEAGEDVDTQAALQHQILLNLVDGFAGNALVGFISSGDDCPVVLLLARAVLQDYHDTEAKAADLLESVPEWAIGTFDAMSTVCRAFFALADPTPGQMGSGAKDVTMLAAAPPGEVGEAGTELYSAVTMAMDSSECWQSLRVEWSKYEKASTSAAEEVQQVLRDILTLSAVRGVAEESEFMDRTQLEKLLPEWRLNLRPGATAPLVGALCDAMENASLMFGDDMPKLVASRIIVLCSLADPCGEISRCATLKKNMKSRIVTLDKKHSEMALLDLAPRWAPIVFRNICRLQQHVVCLYVLRRLPYT